MPVRLANAIRRADALQVLRDLGGADRIGVHLLESVGAPVAQRPADRAARLVDATFDGHADLRRGEVRAKGLQMFANRARHGSMTKEKRPAWCGPHRKQW